MQSKNQPDGLTTEQPRQSAEVAPDGASLDEKLNQLAQEMRNAAITALCLPDGDLTHKVSPELSNKIRVQLRHLVGTLARKGVQPNDTDLRVIGGNK